MKLNPIQDGPFWGCSRMGEGIEKAHLLITCYTYVIPSLKKIQKILKSREATLKLCWHQHFQPEINILFICYIGN